MNDLKLADTYTFDLVINFQCDAFFNCKCKEDRS